MAVKPPIVDDRMLDQYNTEAAFRSDAYWDSIQESNPIVQGFRFIAKNYEISFEKQDKLGKQGDGYHLRIQRRKRPRNDL